MTSATRKQAIPALLALTVAAALAGCGSDSSGESTSSTPAAIPTVTSPLSTPSTTAASTTAGKKKGETTTTTAATGGCTVPDAFQDFKFAGFDCASAVGIATAWDQNGKDCNTVDNPNVDEGYRRTCTVEGFTCTARRDVHSDGRFVACTQGGQSVRFTWLPA
jgi:hypothetical protein